MSARTASQIGRSNRRRGADCAIDGCEKQVLARGWCGAHYKRWHTYGDPLASAPPRDFAAEFWAKVDRSGGPDACWLWTRYTAPNGYGQVGRDGKLALAHRVAYELGHGQEPGGLLVCHRCDNPPCCNPAHLFLGTHADNMADAKRKGRATGPKGFTNPNTRLTFDQVQEIRRRYRIWPAGRGGTRSNARALAAEFGVCKQYVTELVAGKWRKAA